MTVTTAAQEAASPPAVTPHSSDIASPARQIWAEKIGQAWNRSVQGILDAGKHLVQAKQELPRQDFAAMVENDLPFGGSTVRKLIRIGQDERLASGEHVHKLPPAWGTLYEISKLDDAALEAGIRDGRINPEVQRAAVVKISGKKTGSRSPKPKPSQPVNSQPVPVALIEAWQAADEVERNRLMLFLRDQGFTVEPPAADAEAVAQPETAKAGEADAAAPPKPTARGAAWPAARPATEASGGDDDGDEKPVDPFLAAWARGEAVVTR